MGKIEYSEEFKNKVKKFYPDWLELHSFLDNNSEIVGRYLNDGSSYSDQEIMDIVEDAFDISLLKREIRKIELKKELYKEWYNLYYNK